MTPPSGTQTSEQKLKILQIVNGAFIASVAIYGAVAVTLVQQMQTPAGGADALILPFGVVAAFLTLGTPHLGKMLLKSGVGKEPGSQARFQAFFTAFIICLALREVIAVLGLVLTISSGDINWMFAFGALSIVTMIAGWPSKSKFESYMRAEDM